ncbi:hypothetical protein [Sphingomonas sp.]|jgi:Na+/citrate or Na+/malate symporter|uniref:hypothetical protein n=1 Tax=Sphingomonas sp. TaxID=28214 RepID=UPI002D7F8B75|nr:hypothetical protein [Sphingomonas sp.]HEU0045059.1 hypothetical protein [Sphingomonas sp.]
MTPASFNAAFSIAIAVSLVIVAIVTAVFLSDLKDKRRMRTGKRRAEQDAEKHRVWNERYGSTKLDLRPSAHDEEAVEKGQ